MIEMNEVNGGCYIVDVLEWIDCWFSIWLEGKFC